MSRRGTRTGCALVVLCVLVWPALGWAGKRGQSSPEDRAKLVRLTRQLESDPLGDKALEARQWLIPWLEKAKDITVNVCNLLGPIPGDDPPYSAEILAQMIFSNAAFQIEHPDKGDDKVAVQSAGVEGALRLYEAILKTHPDAHIAFLDGLVQKRNGGQLGEYMKTVVPEKCS